MKKDELVEIFKLELSKIDVEVQTEKELIHNTVAVYMALLLSRGIIPPHLMDMVQTDLEDEVIEIYRKVTYGSMSLKEFKDMKKIKSAKLTGKTKRAS